MSACNVGGLGLIPGSGKSSGEGNGNPLQCSCLENPKDRGVGGLQSTGHKESDVTEQLHFCSSQDILFMNVLSTSIFLSALKRNFMLEDQ